MKEKSLGKKRRNPRSRNELNMYRAMGEVLISEMT